MEKSGGQICKVLAAKKDLALALTSERYFVSILFEQLVGFRTKILLALIASDMSQ